jgi:hypothetical protein
MFVLNSFLAGSISSKNVKLVTIVILFNNVNTFLLDIIREHYIYEIN